MANGLLFGAMLSGLGQGGLSVIEQQRKDEEARAAAQAQEAKWQRQSILQSAMEDRRDARAEANQRAQDERLDRRLANDVNVAEAKERAKARQSNASPLTLLQDLGSDEQTYRSFSALARGAAEDSGVNPDVAQLALDRMVWEAKGRPADAKPQMPQEFASIFGDTQDGAAKLDTELRKAGKVVRATLEDLAHGKDLNSVMQGRERRDTMTTRGAGYSGADMSNVANTEAALKGEPTPEQRMRNSTSAERAAQTRANSEMRRGEASAVKQEIANLNSDIRALSAEVKNAFPGEKEELQAQLNDLRKQRDALEKEYRALFSRGGSAGAPSGGVSSLPGFANFDSILKR